MAVPQIANEQHCLHIWNFAMKFQHWVLTCAIHDLDRHNILFNGYDLQVLACILIRLALSESFCTSCGILALDEPTTNLDTANSASLAEALRNLLELRKDQPHFQLVIITHDEE